MSQFSMLTLLETFFFFFGSEEWGSENNSRYLFFNAFPLHRIDENRVMSSSQNTKQQKKASPSTFLWLSGGVLSQTMKNIISSSSRATLFPTSIYFFSFHRTLTKKRKIRKTLEMRVKEDLWTQKSFLYTHRVTRKIKC